jgi:hypothetical protein
MHGVLCLFLLLHPVGASRCAPAFYSAKGSLKPCLECPAGRSTLDDPAMQARITDCLVRPGHGVLNSSAAGLDAFSLDVSVMTAEQQAGLLVMECPIGYYGAGGEVGSTCTQCPCGSSTQATGATTEADCNGKSHSWLAWTLLARVLATERLTSCDDQAHASAVWPPDRRY